MILFLVGLIIGKGGETIQSLQSRSGAKIVVVADNSGKPVKTVNISGPPTAMERAKRLIEEIIGTVCLF